MKIEVGKFYKTRDGRKARIYALDGLGRYHVHGAILKGDRWVVETWANTGVETWANTGEYYCSVVSSGSDLISEWKEPKPRFLAWVGATGWLYFTSNEPAPGWTRAPWLDEPEDSGK